MSGFLQAVATEPFLQHAVLAGALASIGCGVMGTYVVVKRIAFLAGGLENTLLFLRQKQADNPDLRFNTLPRFDEVVLFE